MYFCCYYPAHSWTGMIISREAIFQTTPEGIESYCKPLKVNGKAVYWSGKDSWEQTKSLWSKAGKLSATEAECGLRVDNRARFS